MKQALLALAAFSVVGAANAQVFSNQAAFLAAIGNDPGAFTNSFGSNASNWNGGTPNMAYSVGANNGLYSDGDFIGTLFANTDLVITFTSGNVRAVGGNFWHSDIADNFISGVPVTLQYSDGTIDTYTPGSVTEFRGYVSNTFLTSVTIKGSGPATPARFASMDNVIVSSVPEPATMTALALGAAAMLRRRRTKKA